MPVSSTDKIATLRKIANLLISAARIRSKIESLLLDPAIDATAATTLTSALTPLTTHETNLATAVSQQSASV
jgi:hypothetical protein